MKKKLAIIVGVILIIGVIVGFNYEGIVRLVAGQEAESEVTAAEPAPRRVAPRPTEEEKAKAIEIALSDPRVQELLEGKEYVVAPEGEAGPLIGGWSSRGGKKIGVVLVICFDKPYWIEYDWPYVEPKDEECTAFEYKTRHWAGMVRGLMISVDLHVGPELNKVVDIAPGPPCIQD